MGTFCHGWIVALIPIVISLLDYIEGVYLQELERDKKGRKNREIQEENL